MHVASSHQSIDVRFVRLRRHAVTQKDDGVDLPFGQAGADL
jgi:hypothetical protein